jgi:hypothetical protein
MVITAAGRAIHPPGRFPVRLMREAAALLLLALGSHPLRALTLVTRTVPSSARQRVGPSVIVGRGRCSDNVWLLNNERQLIQISPSRTVTIRQVRGLQPEDQPWGLACLSDQTTWTLASARFLARIGPDGSIVERLTLSTPWIGLFGAGDRLLFAPLHPAVGSPALATASPRRTWSTRSWRGLLTRGAGSRGNVFAQNLVNCGMATGPGLPCWFPGETSIWLSDGTRASRYAFPWVRGDGVDPSLPLRDVVFVEHDRVWLLANSSHLVDGRRVAGRLLIGSTAGHELARMDLNPPARLVIFATATSCLLLTAGGELMEVFAQ